MIAWGRAKRQKAIMSETQLIISNEEKGGHGNKGLPISLKGTFWMILEGGISQ